MAGKPLDGFSPKVFAYAVTVPEDVKNPPAATAKPGAGCEAKIDLAQSIPGVVHIPVRDQRTGQSSVYLVRCLRKTE